jgi:hypothetical protein
MSEEKMDPKKAFDNLCQRKRRLFDECAKIPGLRVVSFGTLSKSHELQSSIDSVLKMVGVHDYEPDWSESVLVAHTRCSWHEGDLPVPVDEIEEFVSSFLLTCKNRKINERLREALAEYRKFEN